MGCLGSRIVENTSRLAICEWEQAFDAVPDLITVIDRDYRIVRANRAMCRSLGLDESSLVGRRCYEVVHGTDAPPLFCPHAELLGDEKEHAEELVIERTGGTFLVSGSPLCGDDGRVWGSVHVARDITERKRAEDHLRAQHEALAHVERVARMGEMASSLAHELNQPLTGILSNAQAARRVLDAEAPDIDEVRRSLDDIVEDDRRAVDFIRSIWDLVKKEASVRTVFDINDTIRNVLVLVRGESSMRNIPIRTRFARVVPRVAGDVIQIQQVLLNLLLNAGQAMHAVGEDDAAVTIATAYREGRGVFVSVADRGPGIAAEDRKRVFDTFYTTRPGGLGMGLAISRSIVEAHGGRIWTEKRRGGGARLCFALPAEGVIGHQS